MTVKNEVGVTVISHDSERRTLVTGCEHRGCYSRNIHYRSKPVPVGSTYPCLLTLRAVYQVWVFWCKAIKIFVKDGGCHVILLRWGTGAEHPLAVVSAHAGWTTHVQTPVMAVTVMRIDMCGVKTAVSSLTRQSFQYNSSGLVIQVEVMRKATTLLENSSVMVQHNVTQRSLFLS